jgi:hypothetical protein
MHSFRQVEHKYSDQCPPYVCQSTSALRIVPMLTDSQLSRPSIPSQCTCPIMGPRDILNANCLWVTYNVAGPARVLANIPCIQ